MSKIVLNLLFAAYFIYAAVMQYNDPDYLPWVILYGVIALMCIAASFNKFSVPLLALVAVVCAAWGAYLAPAVVEWLSNHEFSALMNRMSAAAPYIEQSREAIGLLIAFAVVIYLLLNALRAGRDRTAA